MSAPAPTRVAGSRPPGATTTVGLQRRRRGRLALISVTAALLLLGLAATSYLGVATPSGADLSQRVAALAGGRPLRAEDVPSLLAHALVAVEDERFYVHHGLDTLGTARAVWDDVTGLCACEGGSTITQQLVKNVYYPTDDHIARKLPGMAVALKVELRTDKSTIIADYLSVVPTGYGLVGARAASCAYFGHGLTQLTPAEAAELAGMVRAPSLYDPRLHPDLARARRDYALDRMVDVGYLTPAQAAAARTEPVLTGGSAHPPNCG